MRLHGVGGDFSMADIGEVRVGSVGSLRVLCEISLVQEAVDRLMSQRFPLASDLVHLTDEVRYVFTP